MDEIVEKLTAGDALFGKVRQAVVGLLFANPEREYYQGEIRTAVGARLYAVQQELRRLTAAGLVIAARRGNRVYYHANQQAPLFPDLRSIARKTTGLARVLGQALAPLQGRIEVAFVFGSLASGAAGPESDVDLMVIGEADLRTVAPLLAEARETLRREINAVVMSPEGWRTDLRGGDHFLATVQTGPKIFLIGDESELERLDQ